MPTTFPCTRLLDPVPALHLHSVVSDGAFTSSVLGCGYEILNSINLVCFQLAVMGHSMINRSGDQETELNLDLRLITGRMAQTLHSYEDVAAKLYHEHIQVVEDHLDEIDSPVLKVQIKSVLEDYKVLAVTKCHFLEVLMNDESKYMVQFQEHMIFISCFPLEV